jgi:glycosyltransferase involved in cell wall biosynthesis/SAM-dependent methyltransferase
MADDTAKIDTQATETFGPEYYASHCGGVAYGRQEPHWGRFFGGIADEIVRSLRPRRVFDAGCAHGFLLEALWDRGVETRGRDISHFAVSEVRADLRSFVARGSIADPIEGEYDLVTCIEVLEHMTEADAVRAIASMAAAASRLLFSSSPTNVEEPTHVNVKPVIWWLQRFAEAGLAPVADYDASFVTPHAYLLEHSAEGRSARELNGFADLVRHRMLAHERAVQLVSAEQSAARATAALAEAERVQQRMTALADAAVAERTRAEAATTEARQEHEAVLVRANAFVAESARLRSAGSHGDQADPEYEAVVAQLRTEIVAAQAARDAILYSTTWRATRPLRRVAGIMPVRGRRAVRQLLRASYWLAALQLGRRMGEWRSAKAPETEYDRWVRACDTLTDDDRTAIRAHIDRLTYRPLISMVMPAHETPEQLLRKAIASVQAQLYPHWELCIADDASPSDTVTRVLREVAAKDPRIKWTRRDSNGYIAAATNSALVLASGEFVALMDHDDLLAEQALYEIAAELEAHPDTDLLYTDEDRIDARGRRHSPYFKTDWNIDLLLGHNMVSHLGVYRRSLLEQIGGLRGGPADGSQDYDLTLRCAAASGPARIRHIPAVLYHWRRMNKESSVSQKQLDRCVTAAKWAINDYLKGQGVEGAKVLSAPAAPQWTRVRWPLPDPAPRVSLIVPTRDRAELLARCAAGLLHRTDYPELELLIVDNDSRDPQAKALLNQLRNDRRVRVLPSPGAFNYPALNNAAVREATGEVIVLINNDIDVIEGDWLREMVSLAMRPDVGAVGAKLLFADGRIQHAGVVLGAGSDDAGRPGVAGHFGYFVDGHEIGDFGQFALTREVSGVTGACLAMRKEVYETVGGLDAEHLSVQYNDVDLCLRIREHGLRVIWTPFAELHHLESASRGKDQTPEHIARTMREADYLRDRWGAVLDNDPFYNPNFDRIDHTFRLAVPARRQKPWRRPQA